MFYESLLNDQEKAIWTGTNEVMSLLIQHEYYHEVLAGTEEVRNLELDATSQSDNVESARKMKKAWSRISKSSFFHKSSAADTKTQKK